MNAANRFFEILVKSGLTHDEAMSHLSSEEKRLITEFKEHEA
jgi:hypothetical protein